MNCKKKNAATFAAKFRNGASRVFNAPRACAPKNFYAVLNFKSLNQRRGFVTAGAGDEHRVRLGEFRRCSETNRIERLIVGQRVNRYSEFGRVVIHFVEPIRRVLKSDGVEIFSVFDFDEDIFARDSHGIDFAFGDFEFIARREIDNDIVAVGAGRVQESISACAAVKNVIAFAADNGIARAENRDCVACRRAGYLRLRVIVREFKGNRTADRDFVVDVVACQENFFVEEIFFRESPFHSLDGGKSCGRRFGVSD